MDNLKKGFIFIPFDINSINLIVFIDVSFVNNIDFLNKYKYIYVYIIKFKY